MSNQKYVELAKSLDELARQNEDSPKDYYGAQFWSDADVELLREAATALRELSTGKSSG